MVACCGAASSLMEEEGQKQEKEDANREITTREENDFVGHLGASSYRGRWFCPTYPHTKHRMIK
jgi:hypothetical protein